jgi:hypothetical protein
VDFHVGIPSVVIDNFNNPSESAMRGLVNREDEPEPLVESYRSLVRSITRKLFKMQRFNRIKIALRLGIGKNLNLLNERSEQIAPQSSVIPAGNKRSLEFRILEPDVHK